MDGNQEMDKLLQEIETKEAAEMVASVHQELQGARAGIQELIRAGVEVKASVLLPTDKEKDSIEVGPADCRVKVYIDLHDLKAAKAKLAAARELQLEAKSLGMLPEPKPAKITSKPKAEAPQGAEQ